MRVDIGGKTVDLKKQIGEGGQARVFEYKGKAIKVYKDPTDLDFAGNGSQDVRNRAGAEHSLQLLARKLQAFPKDMPLDLISPEEPVTKAGRVVGYSMQMVPRPFVLMRQWSEQDHPARPSIPEIITNFMQLHLMVVKAHQKKFVFGDFNDLNVANHTLGVNVFDAEAGQYPDGSSGIFYCTTFTQRFADPRKCNKTASALLLEHPHDEDSDWYAFMLMLYQSLRFITPYDGVYKPPQGSPKIPKDARPLHRITVDHPHVREPKFATSRDLIHDDLLHEFSEWLHKDKRGVWPVRLISLIGVPKGTPVPTTVTTMKGKVKCDVVFHTQGTILVAAVQNGILRYLHHEGAAYYRENRGKPILHGVLDKYARYRVQGDNTLIAKQNRLVAIDATGHVVGPPINVNVHGSLPVYDTNSNYVYAVRGDTLQSVVPSSGLNHTYGSVIENQTLFWVGEKFGFGFYRAGELQRFFVFDLAGSVINDGVTLPRIKGQLVDASCFFSKHYCWFFVSTTSGSQTVNRCILIESNGTILAEHEVAQGDDSWLGEIRGHCAVGTFLFSPTDNGLVRVEELGGRLDTTASFPDTEPFLSRADKLMPGNGGLYVVSAKQISLLQMS